MKENFEHRTDIVRDRHSKAVLSTNKAGYIAAKKRKEERERYIKLEQEVKYLKQNISETNNLLRELLKQRN
jgi:hypothetical protein